MRDRRDYENDVFYEVWRAGGNPDTIDYDRVDDHRWEGEYADYAAECELRCQQRQRQYQEEEDEYYEHHRA